ncbi:hypothetical protein [Streptomyces sp. NPDC097610]|uniref:hypothetical protein n=1 Tax=Streptomyces sp. NPDC097610 TaxID=3157227 RepID=UPI0033171318
MDVVDGDLLSVDFHHVTSVEVGGTVFGGPVSDGRIVFVRGTRPTADPLTVWTCSTVVMYVNCPCLAGN